MVPNHWWVTDFLEADGGAVVLTCWLLWIVLSITLHELSHGWAAIRHGDRTPIETGHMTWNPVVHMGPMSLVMLIATGIAWGAMPVNPSRMRGRYADAKVSAAGPMMNVALALGSVVGAAVIRVLIVRGVVPDPDRSAAVEDLWVFFMVGAALNLTLAIFNLVPVPPLDGWRIAASLRPRLQGLMDGEGGRVAAAIAFVALFWFGGGLIFPFAIEVAGRMISAVAGVFGA